MHEEEEEDEKELIVHVRLPNKQYFTLPPFTSHATLHDLKSAIQIATDIPIHRQKVTFRNQILHDCEWTLLSRGLSSDCSVALMQLSGEKMSVWVSMSHGQYKRMEIPIEDTICEIKREIDSLHGNSSPKLYDIRFGENCRLFEEAETCADEVVDSEPWFDEKSYRPYSTQYGAHSRALQRFYPGSNASRLGSHDETEEHSDEHSMKRLEKRTTSTDPNISRENFIYQHQMSVPISPIAISLFTWIIQLLRQNPNVIPPRQLNRTFLRFLRKIGKTVSFFDPLIIPPFHIQGQQRSLPWHSVTETLQDTMNWALLLSLIQMILNKKNVKSKALDWDLNKSDPKLSLPCPLSSSDLTNEKVASTEDLQVVDDSKNLNIVSDSTTQTNVIPTTLSTDNELSTVVQSEELILSKDGDLSAASPDVTQVVDDSKNLNIVLDSTTQTDVIPTTPSTDNKLSTVVQSEERILSKDGDLSVDVSRVLVSLVDYEFEYANCLDRIVSIQRQCLSMTMKLIPKSTLGRTHRRLCTVFHSEFDKFMTETVQSRGNSCHLMKSELRRFYQDLLNDGLQHLRQMHFRHRLTKVMQKRFENFMATCFTLFCSHPNPHGEMQSQSETLWRSLTDDMSKKATKGGQIEWKFVFLLALEEHFTAYPEVMEKLCLKFTEDVDLLEPFQYEEMNRENRAFIDNVLEEFQTEIDEYEKSGKTVDPLSVSPLFYSLREKIDDFLGCSSSEAFTYLLKRCYDMAYPQFLKSDPVMWLTSQKSSTYFKLYRCRQLAKECEYLLVDYMQQNAGGLLLNVLQLHLPGSLPQSKFELISLCLCDIGMSSQTESDFQIHFSRYIHDYEQMLRESMLRRIMQLWQAQETKMEEYFQQAVTMLIDASIEFLESCLRHHEWKSGNHSIQGPPILMTHIRNSCEEENFIGIERDHFISQCLVIVTKLKSHQLTFSKDILIQILMEFFSMNDMFGGCTEKCPFCCSPCCFTSGHLGEHQSLVHFPIGLSSRSHLWTAKSLIKTCPELINGAESFIVSPGKYFLYQDYRRVYPQWNIPATRKNTLNVYWKWILSNFYENPRMVSVPNQWRTVTRREAMTCLRVFANIYHK